MFEHIKQNQEVAFRRTAKASLPRIQNNDQFNLASTFIQSTGRQCIFVNVHMSLCFSRSVHHISAEE